MDDISLAQRASWCAEKWTIILYQCGDSMVISWSCRWRVTTAAVTLTSFVFSFLSDNLWVDRCYRERKHRLKFLCFSARLSVPSFLYYVSPAIPRPRYPFYVFSVVLICLVPREYSVIFSLFCRWEKVGTIDIYVDGKKCFIWSFSWPIKLFST